MALALRVQDWPEYSTVQCIPSVVSGLGSGIHLYLCVDVEL